MEFKNPELNKKYTITTEHDHNIEVPGRYKGKLTDISDTDVVDGMISRKSNLVALKATTAPVAAAAKDDKK